MSPNLRLCNRIATSTVLMAVILALIGMIWPSEHMPMFYWLIIALVGSIIDELVQLRGAPAERQATRSVIWALGVGALVCWAGGCWLTWESPDQNSWMVWGPVGLITMSLIRAFRRGRAARRSAGTQDPRS